MRPCLRLDYYPGTFWTRTVAALLWTCLLAPALVRANYTQVRELRRTPQAFGATTTVKLRGIVTSLSGWQTSFFLQDESGGISVDRRDKTIVTAGDEVEVTGTVNPGLFAPIVVSDRVDIIAHGKNLPPRRAAYEDLARGQLDSQWIEVSGIIHAARVGQFWGRRVLLLDLHMPGGAITVHVIDFADKNFAYLVDSVVYIRGVCGTIFNNRRQLMGVRLFTPSLEQIHIDLPAVPPSEIPFSSARSLLVFNPDTNLDHRVKVTGIVTYQNPGSSLYLQDDGIGVLVRTSQPDQFPPGTRVEATGFASSGDYSPVLKDAMVRNLGSAAAPEPIEVSPGNVITNENGFSLAPYDGLLIRLEGKVVERPPPTPNQVWLLSEGSVLFEVESSRPLNGRSLGVDPGSRVTVTGICVAEPSQEGKRTSFRILLRSAQDFAVLRTPYWTISRLFLVMAFYILLGLAAITWIFHQRRSFRSVPAGSKLSPAALYNRFQRAAIVMASFCCLVGVFVILGWVFDIDLFKRIRPDFIAMAPNTALAFVFTGGFFLIPDRQKALHVILQNICALLGTLIGGLTLIEYVSGKNLHIDHLLFAQNSDRFSLSDPGRMAFISAFSFVLLGTACGLLTTRRYVRLGHVFAIAVAVICLLNLIGYFFGVQNSYGVSSYTFMALHTSICFLLLSTAVLFYRPDQGIMQPISSSALGGFMARRLLLAATFIPCIIGWIHWQGLIIGFYDITFGWAMFVASNIIAFGFLIWTSASLLNHLDIVHSKTEVELHEEQQFRAFLESAPDAMLIVNSESRIVLVNAQTEAVFGYSRTELLGEKIEKLIPERFHADHVVMRDRFQEQPHIRQIGSLDMELKGLRKDGSEFPVEISLSPIQTTQGQQIAAAVRDATKRNSLERRLREGEERYRTLIESIPQFVWTALPDGYCDYLSGSWIQFTGIPELEQLGRGWLQQIHSEERVAFQRMFQPGAEQPARFDFECRMRAANGDYRWFRVLAVPLRTAANTVTKWLGTSTDIHNWKLTEAALIESQASFRQLADAMPQIVWAAQPDGVVDYFNQRWYDSTGVTRTATVEEVCHQVLHPDDVDKYEYAWNRSLVSGIPFEVELRLLQASDGSYRWHLGRAVPVRNAAGQVVRWFGTYTDIEDYKRIQTEIQALNNTLEKRVEQRSAELAASEQQFRLLVDGVHDYAILMLDCDGRVVSWNSGAERIKGYSAEEIIGQHFSLFYPFDDIRRQQRGYELAIARNEGRFEEEGFRVRRDGSQFWANVVITALHDSSGRLRGFSNVTRDITDRKKAAEELISACRLAEEANRAKSDFLAAMSHEIRTPMNAILGMADLLQETSLDQVQREYLHRCRRAGGNLLALINDILDLAKIESGNFDLEHVQFDLQDVAGRAIDLIEPKAHAKGVALKNHISPATPVYLVGDPVRLQQILVNLLSNAVKFTERGAIGLTIAPADIQAESVRLQFEVTDTGIGIPSDKLDSIFDDFTQAESSTTRRFGGTGLGLGIARRLVNRMGGQLTVQSVLGEGSKFSFDAAFGVGTARVNAERPERVSDLAGRRVLLIEPDSMDRLILSKMCYAWGMFPSEAESLAEANSLIADSLRDQRPFALAILEANGFDDLRQIRAQTPELPVVLTTSDNQPGDVTKARSLGAAAFMVKPIRRNELLRIVLAAITAQPVAQAPQARAPGIMKILVAEDSEDNRFLLEVYLKDPAYALQFVENGMQAIDLFGKDDFDLVLMDVQMPVMDGLRATESIRALERRLTRTPTPIIALTANGLVSDIERSQAAGCNGHLTKPISKERLLTAIENCRLLVG